MSGVTRLMGERARALMILGVLGLAAIGAGLLVLGRSQSSSDASPGKAPATKPPAAAPRHAPRGVAPTPVRAPKAPTAPAANAMPAEIAQALAANRVVVVAL